MTKNFWVEIKIIFLTTVHCVIIIIIILMVGISRKVQYI